MASIQDVLAVLEQIAPARYAFPWDKIGLQVGDPSADVKRGLVALDRSLAAIERASEVGAQVLLTHHPLIFEPLTAVTMGSYEGRAVQRLIGSGISHIAAHTNWDAARGGINDALADRLGLADVVDFGSSADANNAKLVFFVPATHLESVIDACSKAGAGAIGDYTRCAYYSPGTGTYEAGRNTNPAIGEPGERSVVEEMRVEMICPISAMSSVSKALRGAHPYEEPAFNWLPLKVEAGQSMGRIGSMDATSLRDFVSQVETALETKAWAWGDPSRSVKKVAVVGGAADGEWRAAQRAGASVMVTGEVKQHMALEACESGFAIVAAGHFATEQPGCSALRERMASAMSEVAWELFEPGPGSAGRPL